VRRDGQPLAPSPLPGKVSGFALEPGDVLMMESSGGGGFGDPLDRDPERVAEDVRNDAVSVEAARSIYGVELGPDGTVDPEATRSARRLIRKERLS
jgi:N-methylhydantoinase B